MVSHRRRERVALSLAVVSVLLAAILALTCTLPGYAQGVGEPRSDFVYELPRAVTDSLAKAGLSGITNLKQRGPNFTMNARTRTGALAKIVANATTGAIIGYRVIDPYEQNPGAARLR